MARKRRSKKRLWGALAGLAAGALGTTLLLRRRAGAGRRDEEDERGREGVGRWARPGMPVTFRAELMPGRSRAERSYRVRELLPSGRVTLHDFTGEHAEAEFESLR
ncbi:MAG TPA: hypothetical protein VER32_11030 [Pyrinomonadaceae bacterium]|nr:hypothetical protein [Pyrinomonadaceae bacterium]